jgi:zinc D-Ala-D-Ala carboxypeptidase
MLNKDDYMKKRKKTNNYLLLFFISLGSFFLVHYGTILLNDNGKQLRELNYSVSAIKLIIKNNLDSYLIENNIYSKTLEVALTEGDFVLDNLDSYVYFEYKNYDRYIKHINNLKQLGYKNDEINVIFEHLTPNDIDIIISKNKEINNLGYYITDQYFKIDNLDRYVNYKTQHPNYSYKIVINYVNISLDYNFYEKIYQIQSPDNTLVLVNKYYQLNKEYIPKSLLPMVSQCSISNDVLVTKIVKDALEEMCSDMQSIGLTIKAISGYRSYQAQELLYNNYVLKDGKILADTYSARPGHSEHQTGLAIDIYNAILPFTSFDKTEEYTWIKTNAHKYGFIIRYPKNKEHITGYKYEPWHLRYVGKEVATYIYNYDITFDEYYGRFIEK